MGAAVDTKAIAADVERWVWWIKRVLAMPPVKGQWLASTLSTAFVGRCDERPGVGRAAFRCLDVCKTYRDDCGFDGRAEEE